MRELPWNALRGYLMGAADLVPGVSGGTLALVLGIYERFLTAIRNGSRALGAIARLDLSGATECLRQVEWRLVLPLLVGLVSAIATLSHLIEHLLHEYPIHVAGAFNGLAAGSVVIAWPLMRANRIRLTIMSASAVASFLLLGIRGGTSEAAVAQAVDPALFTFFFAGAIAICAMVLPGISGSFLLVIMGMYGPTLAAVTSRSWLTLAVFILGATLGLAVFSQVLHWGLRNHHDPLMAALIGLMIGSIRVLWPWPNGVDSTAIGTPTGPVVAVALLAVVGLVVVMSIHRMSQRTSHTEPSTDLTALRHH